MHNDMYKRTDNNFHSRPVTLTATKQNQRAMKAIEQGFNFEYGATREQACIMCHLSAECGGCCVRCIAERSNLSEQIAHKVGGGASQLNPLFVQEMMGFPPDWLASPFLGGGRKP